MKIILPALPLLALAACATPENRVRTALMDAGIAPPVAACMADRMVDRLSYAQLNRLSQLSGLTRERIGNMTLGQFTRELGRLGDPEIVSVVASAGVGCWIAS